jgi:hypothetical protein
MKAIIISDSDAKALLDSLELTSLRAANHWPQHSKLENEAILEAHRTFHLVITRWLQEMGADLRR